MKKTVVNTFEQRRQVLEEELKNQETALQKSLKYWQIFAVTGGITLITFSLLQQNESKKRKKSLQQTTHAAEPSKAFVNKTKSSIFGKVKQQLLAWAWEILQEKLQEQAVSFTTQLLKKYATPKGNSREKKTGQKNLSTTNRP